MPEPNHTARSAGSPEPTVYVYRGDKWTNPNLRMQTVRAVIRADGKTVRGRNGNMLVTDATGRRHVVLGRQLRKVIN